MVFLIFECSEPTIFSYEKIENSSLKEILKKIFGSDSKESWDPKDDDVEQGDIGDCYLYERITESMQNKKRKK